MATAKIESEPHLRFCADVVCCELNVAFETKGSAVLY